MGLSSRRDSRHRVRLVAADGISAAEFLGHGSTRARRAAADRGCGPYFLGLPPPRVGLAPPANFLRLSPASGSRFPTLNVDLHDAVGSRQANIVQPQGRPGDQIIEVDGQTSTGSPNWTSLIKAITTALNR